MDFLLTSRMIVLAREGSREKGVREPGVTQYSVAVANMINKSKTFLDAKYFLIN